MLEVGESWGGRDGARFEALRQLGRGGQAVAFLVRDHQLRREVVAKVCTAREGIDRDLFSQRFEREQQLTARVKDRHVVEVHDVGELPSGYPYILLEYVEGGSLTALVQPFAAKGRGLPEDQALALGYEIALALDAVHRAGIIHRDVKPDNLLLTSSGSIKLTDFGIAKDTHEEEQPLTFVGTTVGTPGFWAPEQARGEPTFQSDVFSFGIVLYYMLRGQLPPQRQYHLGTHRVITTGEVLPEAWEDFPPSAAPLLQWLTARDLEVRAPDFAAVLERLRELRESGSDPALAPTYQTQPSLPSPLVRARGGPASPASSGTLASSRVTPLAGAGRAARGVGLLALAAVGAAAVLLVARGGGTPIAGAEALSGFEAAAAEGDGAKAAVFLGPLPDPGSGDGFSDLAHATDSLLAGRWDEARARARAISGVGDPVIAARAALVVAAADRLESADGYGTAAGSYTAAAACRVAGCDGVAARAAAGLADACRVEPDAAACAGQDPGGTAREAAFARAAVLLGDGHDDAARSALESALDVPPVSGESRCAEAAVLARFGGGGDRGEGGGLLAARFREAGRAVARTARECAAAGGRVP